MSPKVLVLNLKTEYFNAIKEGVKKFEYRISKKYWEKRLINREYDFIEIRLGYPKSDEKNKILKFKWEGFDKIMLQHKEFGDEPVEVFAIKLSERINYS